VLPSEALTPSPGTLHQFEGFLSAQWIRQTLLSLHEALFKSSLTWIYFQAIGWEESPTGWGGKEHTGGEIMFGLLLSPQAILEIAFPSSRDTFP
jgi:hypothetical protein